MRCDNLSQQSTSPPRLARPTRPELGSARSPLPDPRRRCRAAPSGGRVAANPLPEAAHAHDQCTRRRERPNHPPDPVSGGPLLEAALAYAAAGLHVFPCTPGGKAPLGSAVASGHLAASNHRDQILEWWRTYPDANIGISLEPSGLVALDVDTANGKPGKTSLLEFADALPDTRIAVTGRGGYHVLFARPPGVEPRRRIGFRPGLDLLGKGYIVAAPSVLEGAGSYSWANETPFAPLPAVLAAELNSGPPSSSVSPLDTNPGQTASLISEGGRNDALHKLGCALRDQGISQLALRASLHAENRERCAPPLPESEVEQIAASIWSRVTPTRDVAQGPAFRAVIEDAAKEFGIGSTPKAEPRTRRSALLSDLAMRERPPIRTYATHLPHLDAMIGGGISTRQLAVVCAPPADGKSAFVVALGLHLEPTVPVLHVSTELESDEVLARYAAPELSAPWTAIVRGALDPTTVRDAMLSKRVRVIGCEVLPRDGEEAIREIALELEEMTAEYGVAPVLVIDYLQDLARGVKEEQVRTRVGDFGTLLRSLSQKFDCAVIAVSSVSRSYYGAAKQAALRSSDDPRSYLAAAKESGDVDFAAATVLFLDVDVSDPVTGGRPARIAVAKARHGNPSFAGARFFGASGRWEAAPEALVELTAEATKARRNSGKVDEVRKQIYDHVRALQAKGLIEEWGLSHCPNRTSLKKAIPGNDHIVLEALNALIEDGYLDEVPEPRHHGDTKGPNKIKLGKRPWGDGTIARQSEGEK